MYISELDVCKRAGVVRAEAKFGWEDVDKPAVTYFAEVGAQCEDSFWPDPNGCLLGSILGAWRHPARRRRR